MVAASETRLDEIAQSLFDLATYVCLAGPRGRRRGGDLREIEFLALSLLQERPTMIVGEMQRRLGVLPAQMSRIVRSLEDRGEPLISCRINARDKRKVDVCLTEAGTRALADYHATRVGQITDLLRELGDEEREELGRLLDKVRSTLMRKIAPPSAG